MEIKDFWYILCPKEELRAGNIFSCELLGEWLVAFLDEKEKPVVMQDRCLHRASQLSRGCVKNGKIQCSYHGWTYDSEGQVTFIPAEGPLKEPTIKKKAVTYRVREQDGYYYVNLSSNIETQSQPFKIPFFKEKGWTHIRLKNLFANNVTNCIENFLDVPHTVFVHPKIFRTARGGKTQSHNHENSRDGRSSLPK